MMDLISLGACEYRLIDTVFFPVNDVYQLSSFKIEKGGPSRSDFCVSFVFNTPASLSDQNFQQVSAKQLLDVQTKHQS